MHPMPLAATPPRRDGSRQGVDGLEVGHRLMEAGEYELALKAYYRAGVGTSASTPMCCRPSARPI